MSWIAQILRLDVYDRKKLVVCGISAGFSAVLNPTQVLYLTRCYM